MSFQTANIRREITAGIIRTEPGSPQNEFTAGLAPPEVEVMNQVLEGSGMEMYGPCGGTR